MGFGFRVSLKWNNHLPVASHFLCNGSSPPRLPSSCSSPGRGPEASTNSTKLPFLSITAEESDSTDKDISKVHPFPSVTQTFRDGISQTEGMKVKARKRPRSGLDYMVDATTSSAELEDFVLGSSRPSQFGLLLENLDILEESVADSNGMKLEDDILFHLDRLGALELFNTYLTRTLQKNIFNLPNVPTEGIKERRVNRGETSIIGSGKNTLDLSDVPPGSEEKCVQYVTPHGPVEKLIISTGKKEQRLTRRERLLKMKRTATSPPMPSQTVEKGVGGPSVPSANRRSNSKSLRLKIARNEAEFSKGVKVVSELERIWTILEKETGQVPSLSSWAEAAKLDKKMLQQQLRYGWYCRDELIRSTRSLVLFLARNYRVFGVAWEDLLQAGYVGVLQGAERFDHTKGNKFSTYVRFWIQKSMRRTIAYHSRGIQLPSTLSSAMSRIDKARKTLSGIHGKAPDDEKIANFTGFTVANIESASKCARVVGFVDQNVGDRYKGKYMEFIPDTSAQSPEEAVMRQHMKKDIHSILRGLNSKDREVLTLRFGFKDNQPKSLEEVGRIFHVSKEWVRRLQNKVLMKIGNEKTREDLIHYAKL